MENEDKKEYLRKYRKHERRINRISAEIEEIRLMKLNASCKGNSGMPRGSRQQDLSDYVLRLEELEESLYTEGVERTKEYKEIMNSVQQLEDESERDILFYRYIKGLSFWEISDKMGYSERQIHRIHGRALFNLKINPRKIKDVSECQSDM